MASVNVAQLLTSGAASDPEQLPAVDAHTSGQIGRTSPDGSHGMNSEAHRNGSSELTQFDGRTVTLIASAACVVPAGMYTSPELGIQEVRVRHSGAEWAHMIAAQAEG